MSVRAYRIIKIKTEDKVSFNCYHDQWIMDMADLKCYDEGGEIELAKEDVENKLKEILKGEKKGKKFLDISNGSLWTEQETDDFISVKEAIKTLKNILKGMGKEDYMQYYCF